ncbi:MAG: sigma-70 family RNA polymerase sigma factor, partial [Ruminococcaceae bacterium]|nr:sigma-70 family RNA polymerase sigma factor [Oscillospiraceae bacterium]
VYYYALSLAKNREIAEDITSETFFKAMNSLSAFKGKSNIRVWLCSIAKNSYFSYLRRHKLESEISKPILDSGYEDIQIRIGEAELEENLRVQIDKLKSPYREVLLLRVYRELSFKRIAEIMKKTENWACVTFHRAKSKLKEGLNNGNK